MGPHMPPGASLTAAVSTAESSLALAGAPWHRPPAPFPRPAHRWERDLSAEIGKAWGPRNVDSGIG